MTDTMGQSPDSAPGAPPTTGAPADPLFSVVICTYNRADLVTGAVDSVLAQTDADLEVIVVDDGSTDTTPEVLAAYDDPRLQVIRRENGGLSAARNSGIAATRGRFVAFLDDDDRLTPDWTSEMAAGVVDSTGFTSCTCYVAVPGGGITGVRRSTPHPLFDDIHGAFVAGTFALDRSLLLEIGGYDEEIPTNHQTELLLRALPLLRERGMTTTFCDKPLVAIERRDIVDRAQRRPARTLRGAELLIERHGGLLATRPAVLADYHAVAGVSAAQVGDRRLARRHLFRAVRLVPTSRKHLVRFALSLIPLAGGRIWARPEGDPRNGGPLHRLRHLRTSRADAAEIAPVEGGSE